MRGRRLGQWFEFYRVDWNCSGRGGCVHGIEKMSYVQYSRPKAPCGALNVRGMGQDASSADGTGLSIPNPLSIFSNLFSSTDISTWGAGEWVAIAGVGLLVWNVIGGISSAGGKVKRSYRKRKRKSQQKQALLSQLESL